MELSGGQWVNKFPTSKTINDLVSPFREHVKLFIDALTTASATVHIDATLRPRERAYLMHYSFLIAKENFSPQNVPPFPGVDINWVHPTLAESKAAANEMVTEYGIVFEPALSSKHSTGTAIDMAISWVGPLQLKQADGTIKHILTAPRDNNNPELHQAGATYGVIKLVSDKPHWSDNGH